MVKLLHDKGDEDGRPLWYSARFVRTTQVYGLPHAKAKAKSSLFHKFMESYNTDDKYKWSQELWLGNFLNNHMRDKVNWLHI